MKKFAALVLALVLSMSLFTTAFAGDEPLYEANEIANKLEEILGYKPEVTLEIQDIKGGADVVYFEVYVSVRGQSYYWDAEYILGQYVLTEESFWDMVDSYPSWELLPWESAETGRHFWYEASAQKQMRKVLGEDMLLNYVMTSDDSMEVVLIVGEDVFRRVLEYGEFVYADGEYIVEQSVLTELYCEVQER